MCNRLRNLRIGKYAPGFDQCFAGIGAQARYNVPPSHNLFRHILSNVLVRSFLSQSSGAI